MKVLNGTGQVWNHFGIPLYIRLLHFTKVLINFFSVSEIAIEIVYSDSLSTKFQTCDNPANTPKVPGNMLSQIFVD